MPEQYTHTNGSGRCCGSWGRGEPNAVIATQLFVSEATVKTYVSRLLGKLELTNRTQAAILAHEAGLLES